MSEEEQRPPTQLVRRKALKDRGIDVDDSTPYAWTMQGRFPKPVILNPGQKREIKAWREDEVQQWIDTRPQRLAVPVTQKAYEARRAKTLEKRQQRKIIRRPTV